MKDDYIQGNENLDIPDNKVKKIGKSKAKRAVQKIKKAYKAYNPLKNKAEVGNGVTVKWNVKPHYKKEKFKVNLEVSKNFGDVELYAKIDGQVFRVMEDGLGYDLNKDAYLNAELGANMKF